MNREFCHKGTKAQSIKKDIKSLCSLESWCLRGILTFALMGFFMSSSGQSSTCWPSERGNNALSGYTKVKLPNDLKLLWSFKTEDAIKSSPVFCGKSIFVGSNDGNLYCLSKEGKLNWTFETETSIESTPLYLNGIVYFGNLGGDVYAINAKNGKQIWKFETQGQISGAANWTYKSDKKGKQILIGSYDFYMYCIDAKTGKLVWKYETDNYINGCPAINARNTVFGGCDGFLHSVDIHSGKANEKIDIGTYIA
ncbi:MAG: PQQ-like beta-propeller repeat protein, partial [Bacteroidetes bacterium]|nr:PQQ-like beta-propeller repeat protein [Bacteroidota bacterium]